MATVNELVTKFSFQGSPQPLDQYNQYLSSSISLLGATAAALGVAAGAMHRWTTSVLSGLQPLIDMQKQTQVSVQFLREWGLVADKTGSDAQTLQSSVQSLNDQIGQAALEGSEDFARLGISVRDSNGDLKNAEQILREVRTRFKEMDISLQEAQTLASSIGIDPSLVRMLRMSSEEFRAMTAAARRYGEITREHTEDTHQFNNSMEELRFGLDTIKTLIAVGLAPMLERFNEWMQELLVSNKNLIVNGVQWLGEWIGNLTAAISRLAPFIGTAIGLFAAWKAVTWALNSAIYANPVFWLIGGIVALLLILDDLIVAFRGGKSVIADFFQEFFGIDIQPHLQQIVDDFKTFMGWLGNMFSADFWAGIWSHMKDTGKEAVDNIKQTFQNLFQWMWSWIETITKPLGGLANMFGFGGGDQQPREQQQFRGGGMVSNRTLQDARTVQQNNNINIQTDNPEQAGRSVDRSLRRQMRDAEQHTRGGSLVR
jgi:hypothetical protein